ncbi:WbqC family protein [Sphingobacterium sp. HJSM2_6]|uniref:WbqC family protein n=1 Tax=Sphingobacterium sp. HJSM2_6 TaxID=3366264 RepID=UPI003BCEA5A6
MKFREKIGIIQPYFFPYLGYISLIKHTDRFILLDSVQFINRGWIERNRIIKQHEGWLYIQVPLIKTNGSRSLIKDCLIDNSKPWKEKILAQLEVYKRVAPYYQQTIDFIKGIFSKDFEDITSLNKHILIELCNYLNMPREISVFTKMDLQIDQPQEADDWCLNICKSLGRKLTYVNPIGGLNFYNREKYHRADVGIFFHSIKLKAYKQDNRNFEPGLSILDALMFNSKEEIHQMLDQYELN